MDRPPWGSALGAAPGAELRNYEPSWWDYAKSALNSVGGNVYPDLGQRTEQTFDLLSVPTMLAPLASPAKAAAAGSGPAWDAAIARVLQRKYPDEKVISGGAPGIGANRNWFGLGGDGYWDSSRGLAREHDIPRASRTNGMSWDPSAKPVNDQSPISDEMWKYLTEVLAQRSRANFRTVP